MTMITITASQNKNHGRLAEQNINSGSNNSSSSLLNDGVGSQLHYMEFGRCQNVKTGKTRCAVSIEDCVPPTRANGEKWYNAIRIKERGIDEPSCTCDRTLIGSCKYETSSRAKTECAPRSFGEEDDYCRKDENEGKVEYSFLPSNAAGTNCFCDKLQSLEDDTIPNLRTKYGACYVPGSGSSSPGDKLQFFCSYSSEYCTGVHVWVHPNDVPDVLGIDGKYCHCEDTHVGGCVGGFQDFHCGTSTLDCRSNSFFPPIDLKNEHNHACLLCNEKVTIDPPPTDEIDRIQSNGKQDKEVASTESTSSSSSSSTIIPFQVIAAMVVLISSVLILVTIAYTLRNQRRERLKEQHRQQLQQVLPEITIDDHDGDDDHANNNDNDEQVVRADEENSKNENDENANNDIKVESFDDEHI